MGESGSGKCRLSGMILGVEKGDEGEVRLEGEGVDLKKVRGDGIGGVFQDYSCCL
ncbi:ATP-binding cassette domain-containing protein, partial [Staphylococcus epidermidis]|uniref:ATP-binding cassette domain-containing protein n=1 Tax=Staphylococcus epidermidis TaxID=1282 RepID=UPI0037D9C7EF